MVGMVEKVGDGVKRLCAALVACVIMWYCVITAPVFRVSAIDQGSGIASIGSALIGGLFSLVADAQVFNPVVGAALGVSLPFIVGAAQESVNPDVAPPLQLPKSIPSSSAFGYYVSSDDVNNKNRQLTYYSYAFDYTGLNTSFGVAADAILVCPDYQLGVVCTPSEDWLSSSSRSNMSVQLGITFNSSTGSFNVAPTCVASDSSGVTPTVDISYYFTFSDGSGFHSTLTRSGTSLSPVAFACVLRSSQTFTFTKDSFQRFIDQSISNGYPIILSYNSGYLGNATIPSSSYPVLSSPITTSEQAIEYYDNSVRPYVINNYSSTYPEYTEQFITYQEYYETLDPVPSETTTPGTGVIIIDPFTLPPEWVQSDVVELETEHYTIDYDGLVNDPFDYLVSPFTETSTQTVRAASGSKAVEPSPPSPQYNVFPRSGSIQELANDYLELGYDLLTRSGLVWVVGVCVFGLVISIL